MKVATYVRVSTSAQDLGLQTDEIERYCNARGWEIVLRYSDTASGAKENREGLEFLWDGARKRKFKAVVVYRFDRFARSLRQLVTALDEFRELGIEFCSIHENIDTSSSQGRLVFGIFASIAEFERELIRDRVKSGIAHARNKGKRIGAMPKHRHKMDQVVAMKANGVSTKKIGDMLNMSSRSVWRLLDRAKAETPVSSGDPASTPALCTVP